MKDKGKLVIWPTLIDLKYSRNEGRKTSKKNSVREPTLDEIKNAAKKLGLNPEIELKKAYPKRWWVVCGRVFVDKNKPKTVILKEISNTIKQLRSK
ncbi:MAG: signal recognition particle protein Srp19 [Methanosarcinaceae archaeon]|jgi:signal recognition particle subunit SRP19|nr:signal recognition particle protein Srp19 [Methanosarcinaceae archaeon]NKQ39211.1 signal recognition particle protein Srp19 [Methanosarcinales archaeon]